MSRASTAVAVATVASTRPHLSQPLESVIDHSTGDLTPDLAQTRFLDAAGLSVIVDAGQPLGDATTD